MEVSIKGERKSSEEKKKIATFVCILIERDKGQRRVFSLVLFFFLLPPSPSLRISMMTTFDERSVSFDDEKKNKKKGEMKQLMKSPTTHALVRVL